MLVGHYAPAFLIKAVCPRMPLGLLFVAVQLADIAWAALVIVGVEKVRITPGFSASNPLDLYFMPYTHSLAAALLWAVGSMLVYRLIPRIRPWAMAGLLGLAVLSHWALDLLVHVHDLPLYADDHKVGFGLWNHPSLSLALEIGLVVCGAWVLAMRQAPERGTSWSKPLWLCLILVLVQAYSAWGPIPPSAPSLAATMLVTYAALATAAWKLDSRSGKEQPG